MRIQALTHSPLETLEAGLGFGIISAGTRDDVTSRMAGQPPEIYHYRSIALSKLSAPVT
ncbi:hypothetical protein ANO14919_114590 [Xylariales sp. No.14919]|nr:hypothetical protein ANO14919_114590 [Xylariales sp. No.14919]